MKICLLEIHHVVKQIIVFKIIEIRSNALSFHRLPRIKVQIDGGIDDDPFLLCIRSLTRAYTCTDTSLHAHRKPAAIESDITFDEHSVV